MKQRVAALEFVTACLRPQISTARIRALASTLTGLPLGWETTVGLANRHFVIAAVWAGIRKSDVVDCLPADLRGYLAAIHQLNKERNERARSQASDVVRHLNELGITPVLLKGAAHLYTDTFADRGARMMADLDLFIPGAAIQTAWGALVDVGYRPRPAPGMDYVVHHHLAPLVCPGKPFALELHRSVTFSARTLIPAASAMQNARTVANGDKGMLVLSPTDQILHNFWHSEIDDEGYRRGVFSLRYLHELVLLDAHYRDDIDWSRVRRSVAFHGRERALDAYLHHARRLFGFEPANGAVGNLASELQYFRCYSWERWSWARYVEKRLEQLHYLREQARAKQRIR